MSTPVAKPQTDSDANSADWIRMDAPHHQQSIPLPGAQDVVSIRNLQLHNGIKAPNIWGDIKEQPASVTVQIHLSKTFSSAADADALDDSTIHYGELSKRVRKACAAEAARDVVLEVALSEAEDMAASGRVGGERSKASRIEVELVLPKASAYGASLGLREARVFAESGEQVLAHRSVLCKGLRIMTLIGVNEYERRGKQPLVVDFELDLKKARSFSQDDMVRLFPLERVLVEIIEKTEFETLETLAEFTLKQLNAVLSERKIEAWALHLKFEKPAAVAFADAPVIEVHRRFN